MRAIASLSARELVASIARREVTVEAVVTHYLAQIEAREPDVHAWQCFDPQLALAQARRLDAGGGAAGGAFMGLPIGVKDLMDTADMPTTYGSPIYAGHRPRLDAACVASSRAAGAVVMGKTVTTEFATFQPGPTRNPRALAGAMRTPGGSSSGSAAAVAAGMVPIAFGSQTAGSIIRPAAYCGIVGYKPTFGTLPCAGVKALAPSLDTIGVLARSVDDAAFFVGTLARLPFAAGVAASTTGGYAAGRAHATTVHGSAGHATAANMATASATMMGLASASATAVGMAVDTAIAAGGRLRIGVCRALHAQRAHADSRHALAEAAAMLGAAGATVRDVTLPPSFDALTDVQIRIMGYEAAAAYAPEARMHPDLFSAAFARLVADGAAIDGAQFYHDQAQAAAARAALAALYKDVDILLAPSTEGEAPLGIEATGDPLFNRLWTLLGNPCVHVPTGRGAHGMPVGVTLIGPRWGDAKTLAAAALLERGAGFNPYQDPTRS